MKRGAHALCIGFLLTCCPLAQADDATDAPSSEAKSARAPMKLSWEWRQGLLYKIRPLVGDLPGLAPAEQRAINGRVAAKLHIDGAIYRDDDEFPGVEDGIEIRRARVYTIGSSYFLSPLTYKLEFGFDGTGWFLHEAYVWWLDVPLLNSLKFGNISVPFSLESLESSRDTTLMEMGSPVEAFSPGIRLGAMAHGLERDDRLTWSLGWFADVEEFSVGDASESVQSLNGRLTYLPYDEFTEDTHSMIHTGVSVSFSQSKDGAFQYRSRPESFLAPRLVDTGSIDADDGFLYGLELAGVHGPFSLQAEFIQVHLFDLPRDLHFEGGYIYGSWFLTGESRPYRVQRGVFGQVKPRKDFSWKHRTWGAFELTARLSRLDLSNEQIRGGEMNIVMGGFNWYWNPYVRLMFNAGYADISDTDETGDLALLQTRVQMQF